MYEPRDYRSLFKGAELVYFDVCVDETDLRIGADKNLYSEAHDCVRKCRKKLKAYIRSNPEFLTSLEPLEPGTDAPAVAARMCRAARKAGVGPMAAVAGAIAEEVGFELLRYSSEVIVENGGDIFIKTGMPRKVGIYAGKSPLSGRIALEITPDMTPMGVCTSSGTVGHSLSFGNADAAVALSRDAALADAAATAAGNIVKSAADIEKALHFALNIEGVTGAVIIIGDRMGACGNVRFAKL